MFLSFFNFSDNFSISPSIEIEEIFQIEIAQ